MGNWILVSGSVIAKVIFLSAGSLQGATWHFSGMVFEVEIVTLPPHQGFFLSKKYSMFHLILGIFYCQCQQEHPVASIVLCVLYFSFPVEWTTPQRKSELLLGLVFSAPLFRGNYQTWMLASREIGSTILTLEGILRMLLAEKVEQCQLLPIFFFVWELSWRNMRGTE